MNKLQITLFLLGVLIFLVIFAIVLLVIIVLFPIIAACLILMRTKLREILKKMWLDTKSDFKWMMFGLLTISSYPFARLVKFLKGKERIIIRGEFPKEEKKLLIVSNHPSWFDQIIIFLIHLMSSDGWFKRPNLVPHIGAAQDSIERLPILKVFETFYFVLPITRNITRVALEGAKSNMEALKNILREGYNLIISGPPGRDSKARKDEERIYSSVRGKQLRKFGGLCGELGILPGVTTVPIFIEGIDKISDNKGGEIIFSLKKLLVDFLLLGKFKIIIIFGEPLILEGRSQEEARQVIEGKVLELSDLV